MSRTGPEARQPQGRRTGEPAELPRGEDRSSEPPERRPEAREPEGQQYDERQRGEPQREEQESVRRDWSPRSVEVRGSYTVEEARALVIATNGRRLLVGAGFGVSLALTPGMTGSVLAGLLTGAVALVVIGGLLAWMVLVNLPNRVVRAIPEDITWTVDTAGFRIRTPEADTSVGWDDIERVAVSRRLVRFRRASRSSFLPRRLLSADDLVTVTAIAAEAGVPVTGDTTPGTSPDAG